MSKYEVEITCDELGALPVIPIDADSDGEAVDKGRALHAVPDDGGSYEFVVRALESRPGIGPKGSIVSVPPGEVSRFRVSHEPAEHKRDEVYAKRSAELDAAEKAAERERIKAEVRAEFAAEQAAAAAGKAVQS